MNKREHLLTIMAEECAETAQRCSKALRFGLMEKQEGQPLDNSERIEREFFDLIAAYEMLVDAGAFTKPLNSVEAQAHIAKKKAAVNKYFERSKECGTLDDETSILADDTEGGSTAYAKNE